MRPWPRLIPFPGEMPQGPEIRIDLSESDQAYTVRAEIPGARKEDVKVHLEGNRVSISAESQRSTEDKKDARGICSECFRGSSHRSFTLERDVDDTRAEARYENGVLELTLPKKAGGSARNSRSHDSPLMP